MPAEKKPGCYRLLHTADWHLGKLLNDQSRDAEHAAFLDWLLDAVAEHRVDLRDCDPRVGKEGDGSAEIQAQFVSGIQSG